MAAAAPLQPTGTPFERLANLNGNTLLETMRNLHQANVSVTGDQDMGPLMAGAIAAVMQFAALASDHTVSDLRQAMLATFDDLTPQFEAMRCDVVAGRA